MADLKNLSPTLTSRYVPDEWDGVGTNPHDIANPITGVVEVGVNFGGAFRVLGRFPAAGLSADIDRASQQQADQNAQGQSQQ